MSSQPSTINSPQSTPANSIRTTLHTEVREPAPLPVDGGRIKGEGHTTHPESSIQNPESLASCLDFISSDESLDRYNEIISASGWKLDNYLRNPVFQNAHQYGDILFTLGRALITEVRTRTPSTINSKPSSYLFQRIEFACDINPMAKIAYGLYKGKFLNAVSVGFVPLRWEDGSSDQEVGRGVPTAPVVRRRYLEQELLEVSAVGIPANPNALALGLKSGAIQKSDLRDLSDLIQLTLSRSADFQSAVSPISNRPPVPLHQPSTNHNQLSQMLKHLHSLLRS